MKKTFLAALASLMLVGAISAASGLNTVNLSSSSMDLVVMMRDGSAPLPASASPAGYACDLPSQNK